MTFLAVDALRNRSRAQWEWSPLRRVTQIRRTANVDSSADLLAVSSEEGVRPRPDDGGRQLPSEATIAAYWLVEPGDLVFNPMWAIGRGVAVSNISGAVSTAYRVYKPGPRIHPRFLHYYMRSDPVVEQYSLVVRGLTTFDRSVTRDDLEAMPVPVPPLQAQQAIADYLDTETARIDALIEKKRRMLTLLEEKFLEVVRNQVTGGISFDDSLDIRSKDVLNLRAGWAPVKLGQDFRFGSGTTPRAGDERYYGGQIPWIVTGDLSDDLLRTVTGSVTPQALAEFSALQVHPVGALIVAMYGATVGRLAVSAFPAAVNQACCVMHSGTRLRTWFVFYYLLSHRPVLMERAVGAGQPNISQEILRSLRIPAPDLEAQDRIVALLDDVHTRVDQLVLTIRTQIGLLQEHRQALTTAAVTGELDAPEEAA